MRQSDCAEPQVIVPNLHWHYSGGTATSLAVLPIIDRMINTARFGPDAPAGASRLGFTTLFGLRAKPKPVVWHAPKTANRVATRGRAKDQSERPTQRFQEHADNRVVVASKAGAAEIVIENGGLRILVPASDAQALGSAIETLMRDPAACAAMGARGRTHVAAKFSLDTEASRTVAVYRMLLASQGACEAEGHAEGSR